jgi:hypothetical protein
VLWLGDVALCEVHRVEAAGSPQPAAALAATLRRMYADRAPQPLLGALDGGDAGAFDAAAERRFGLLLSVDVVRGARTVVVPSVAAARRLRLDQGANGPCPPILVVDPDDAMAVADAVLSSLTSAAEKRVA